jgi:hypothetical protein
VSKDCQADKIIDKASKKNGNWPSMSQKSSDCCSKPEWYEVEKTKKPNSFCILLKNVISLHVTAPPALIDYQTNRLPSTFNSVAEF